MTNTIQLLFALLAWLDRVGIRPRSLRLSNGVAAVEADGDPAAQLAALDAALGGTGDHALSWHADQGPGQMFEVTNHYVPGIRSLEVTAELPHDTAVRVLPSTGGRGTYHEPQIVTADELRALAGSL